MAGSNLESVSLYCALSMIPLLIVGAGGFGRECLDVVEAMNADAPRWDFLGFMSDGGHDAEQLARRGAPYLGSVDLIEHLSAWDPSTRRAIRYVIGIGSGSTRRAIDQRLTGWGREAAVLIHPSATCGVDVEIGPGSVLTAGVRITTNVRIGRHVHLNLNATVGHDCEIGDYVTVNPGVNLSGNVVVEAEATLSTNSVAIPGVRIGAGAMIGAGAVVVRDAPAGETLVGVPAKPITRRS